MGMVAAVARPDRFASVCSRISIRRASCNRVSTRSRSTGSTARCSARTRGRSISGQGVALDFDLAGAAALDYGDRLLFHGDVWVEYPDDVGAVMEIVDVKTGETRYPRDPCLTRLWD
jgi:hypothetical protein